MLEVKDLSFAYGTKRILDDVGFELRQGEMLGVLGPNGAGKSTLIKLISGVLQPLTGHIAVGGREVSAYSRLGLAQQLAVVPQASQLPEAFTAKAIVMMGRTPHLGFLARESAHDHQIVESVMRQVNVWQFAKRLIAELSGGERQRILLARALAQEAPIFLLDEPTNHLDLRYQVEVLRYLRRALKERAALVVLHDLNLAARTCDRVLMLHNGKIVARGTPAEVLQPSLIETVYETKVNIFSEPDGGHTVVMPEV